ncbi:putative pectinesterase/pectinesterase inhibitor 22 [Henckelia pumila]|uniref:putative pectinesterase/pectinesterase inhibitor 22 n=1 Tax=Henckelia pumila TaxID=405737 RepID=UPI003C6E45BE
MTLSIVCHRCMTLPIIRIHEIEVVIPPPQSPQASYDQSDDDDGGGDISSDFSFPNSPQQPLPSLTLTQQAVSKDGKGEFRSIFEALEASPSNSNNPVYINIESGEYYELINVDTHKTNIFLKGAGVDRTVIVSNGSLYGNQSAATLMIIGVRFLARDITIARKGNNGGVVENWSDYSVFYNYKLKGVNESLKAKVGNQFYRNCDVQGQNM